MPEFVLTQIVHKDPQTTWDYFVDPAHTPDWNSKVSEASIDGEPRVGASITTKASFLGVRMDSVAEITECVEPHRYRFATDKPFRLDIAMDLAAVDDGTAITMTADIDPGKMFPIGGRMLAKQIEKSLKKDLATLAANVNAL